MLTYKSYLDGNSVIEFNHPRNRKLNGYDEAISVFLLSSFSQHQSYRLLLGFKSILCFEL